jgi:hypothetical protein
MTDVGATEGVAPSAKANATHPLLTEAVPIDDHCVGDRWSAQDETRLARLTAIIAMGQAAYAAHVLKDLVPATPAFTDDDLCREAKVRLTVQEGGKLPRTGYPRWQRDGFIFEVISWIAMRQNHGELALLKDPHLSATSQGLDGLMIELANDKSNVVSTTVSEDKCTENPREMFVQKVIPALLDRHRNNRSAELVAAASVLLRIAGIDEAAAARLSAAVMDRNQRRYRAAFALTDKHDSQKEREALFKGYDALDGISKNQRIGASLIVTGKLREWFDGLALQAIAYLDALCARAA